MRVFHRARARVRASTHQLPQRVVLRRELVVAPAQLLKLCVRCSAEIGAEIGAEIERDVSPNAEGREEGRGPTFGGGGAEAVEGSVRLRLAGERGGERSLHILNVGHPRSVFQGVPGVLAKWGVW